MLISKTMAVGAIAALLSLGAAGAAFAAGEAEAGASGVTMSAPGVLPIVEETVTLSVAAIPHATVEDLTTNYATEWLEQQTGVHVEWNVLPRNDARQKINLMLTSATDLPDVFLGSGAITPEQATLYGGQGLFLPLNDFIDQYSTEVKRFFEENPLIEKVGTSPDGNIYSLGNYDLCYHCYYSQRVWVQQDVARHARLGGAADHRRAVCGADSVQDAGSQRQRARRRGAVHRRHHRLADHARRLPDESVRVQRWRRPPVPGWRQRGGGVHVQRLARRTALHEPIVRRRADRPGGFHPGPEPVEAGRGR